MKQKKILRKMGFSKKEDLNGMTIEQLVKLGEMGYTKEEIETMRMEEKESATNKPIVEQINELTKQITAVKNGLETTAVRETVNTPETQDDMVQAGLNMLAGALDNEH